MQSGRFFRMLVGGSFALLSVVARAAVIHPEVVLLPSQFREIIGFAGTLAFGDSDALPENLVLSLDLPEAGLMQGFALTAGGHLPRAEVRYRIDFGTSRSSAMADSTIEYWFAAEQFDGEPFDGQVPVTISTSGSAFLSLPDWGTVTAQLIYPGGQFDACAIGSGGCSLPPPSFDETVTITVPANTPQRIIMRVRGQNGGGLPPGGTISIQALVDPAIVIDPAFDLHDQFRLVFSPGLCANRFCSQPAVIPEPVSLALVGAALAGLAVTRRRKQ